MFLERYADYYQTELQEFANLSLPLQLQANAIQNQRRG